MSSTPCSNARTRTNASGFTLVELSIVLVVLGLLVGGVLAGRTLIRSSELRSISADVSKFQSAIETFEVQYNALPGDMPDATQYWGAAAAVGNACRDFASTSAATCDGNGDGTITDTAGSREHFRLWQHLANAGMLEGSYSGAATDTNFWASTPGTNVPRGKISNTGWYASTWPEAGAPNGLNFSTKWWHSFSFGRSATNDYPNGAALTPEEAWNVDKKMDDGIAGSGNVLAQNYATCTNAASQTDSNAAYLLSNANVLCSLAFARAF